jgi:4'-phosphopantetheinyl transferase
MVEVFALKLPDETAFAEKKEHYISFLSEERREHFNRFKNSKSALRSIFGELISRKILSEKLLTAPSYFEFKKTENGKPYLDSKDIHFNLSHSGEWVVFAYCDRETGIDIEKVRPVNYRIAERFFSSGENDILSGLKGKRKLNFFFDLWTLKESYLKMLGTGLTKSLSSFTVLASGQDFRIEEHESGQVLPVFFRQYAVDKEYKLSVCSGCEVFSEKLKYLAPEEIIRY